MPGSSCQNWIIGSYTPSVSGELQNWSVCRKKPHTFVDRSAVKVKVLSCVQLLRPHELYSPGQDTGVGSLSLLQGIFPTQGSNPGLSYCRWILYQLSHKRSPRILDWVAYPFSRGSSRLRNQTRISCIPGRFFSNWAIREPYVMLLEYSKENIYASRHSLYSRTCSFATHRAEE